MDKRTATTARRSLRPQVNNITLDFDPLGGGNSGVNFGLSGNSISGGNGLGNHGFGGTSSSSRLSGEYATTINTQGIRGKQLRASSYGYQNQGNNTNSTGNLNHGSSSSSHQQPHNHHRSSSRSLLLHQQADFPSDNSIARFTAGYSSLEGDSLSTSSILSVSRFGQEQKIRAAEEMAKVRQRSIITEEERTKLVETALSIDAPKVARQVIKENMAVNKHAGAGAVGSSNNKDRPQGSFLTFDAVAVNGGRRNSRENLDEDQEFLKVVDEVERTKKRMLARANGAILQRESSKTKFVLHDPKVSQEILQSIAGLIDDINFLEESQETEDVARKQQLMRLAKENISSVRDSYPTVTPATASRVGVISPVLEVGDEYQSPTRDRRDRVDIMPPIIQASSPRTPKGSSKGLSMKALAAIVAAAPTTPKASEDPKPEMNSSFLRKNRNHHLKVLLLSSLRDWLSLECQVPIGPASTEVEKVCASIPGESPGYRLALGTDSMDYMMSPNKQNSKYLSSMPSPASQQQHPQIATPTGSSSLFRNNSVDAANERYPLSPSSQRRSLRGSKDISKSTASLHAILEQQQQHRFDELGSITEVTSDQQPNLQNNQNMLRFSAKHGETPLFYLSQALRMLESTLVSIGDNQPGSVDTTSSAAGRQQRQQYPSDSHQQQQPSLSEHVGDLNFRNQFRKSLWASALAGSAAGNFVADIISERNLGSS
jgi:hypothetical protein